MTTKPLDAVLVTPGNNIFPTGGTYQGSQNTLVNQSQSELQVNSRGALLVDSGVYNSVPTQTSLSVATTATPIAPANPNITYRLFQNQDATNPVYLLFGTGNATATSACYKLAAGATLIFDGSAVPNTAVSGIATGTTVSLHYMEMS